jgi:acetoin:2,6-dichlorophenolindophenol oxidoreductase subunit beta
VTRQLTYAQAINEALDQCMTADPAVYVMGLGVPDPGGVFGTTIDLAQKHGSKRVRDMPLSENAMTGVATGSALVGMRPVLTHQRIDFALLAIEQMVNQAAKWHYMFGGRMSVPLVVRMIVGRGWGQGPQHSQSLQAWFAHVPGLKVVMPATPGDAKGLLIAAIEDDNPVVFLEHRWLHGISGPVPEDRVAIPLGSARIAASGDDVTLVATSYMVLEALRAATLLADAGIAAEVIDVRTLSPLDMPTITASVAKTGRVVVTDTGWTNCGFAAEIVARLSEAAFADLKAPPRRVAMPDYPVPTSPALANPLYPRAQDIARAAQETLGLAPTIVAPPQTTPGDVPDPSFAGPF